MKEAALAVAWSLPDRATVVPEAMALRVPVKLPVPLGPALLEPVLQVAGKLPKRLLSEPDSRKASWKPCAQDWDDRSFRSVHPRRSLWHRNFHMAVRGCPLTLLLREIRLTIPFD